MPKRHHEMMNSFHDSNATPSDAHFHIPIPSSESSPLNFNVISRLEDCSPARTTTNETLQEHLNPVEQSTFSGVINRAIQTPNELCDFEKSPVNLHLSPLSNNHIGSSLLCHDGQSLAVSEMNMKGLPLALRAGVIYEIQRTLQVPLDYQSQFNQCTQRRSNRPPLYSSEANFLDPTERIIQTKISQAQKNELMFLIDQTLEGLVDENVKSRRRQYTTEQKMDVLFIMDSYLDNGMSFSAAIKHINTLSGYEKVTRKMTREWRTAGANSRGRKVCRDFEIEVLREISSISGRNFLVDNVQFLPEMKSISYEDIKLAANAVRERSYDGEGQRWLLNPRTRDLQFSSNWVRKLLKRNAQRITSTSGVDGLTDLSYDELDNEDDSLPDVTEHTFFGQSVLSTVANTL